MSAPATTIAAPQLQSAASPLRNLASRFSIEPSKLLNTLRGTVIKPDKNGKTATDEELAAFCIVADQYGLNPFTKEIYAFPAGDKGIVPMIGVDGWVKLVNSQPLFDGCEFEEVAAIDGGSSSVTCRMHIKGRAHPICVTERFAECKRNTTPWQQMPWRMLRHKAYMQTARYAFGLAGLFDEDEAKDIADGRQYVAGPSRNPIAMPRAIGEVPPGLPNGTPAPEPPPESPRPKPISKAQTKAIEALLAELDLPPEEIESILGGDVAALTETVADEVRNKLLRIKAGQSAE